MEAWYGDYSLPSSGDDYYDEFSDSLQSDTATDAGDQHLNKATALYQDNAKQGAMPNRTHWASISPVITIGVFLGLILGLSGLGRLGGIAGLALIIMAAALHIYLICRHSSRQTIEAVSGERIQSAWDILLPLNQLLMTDAKRRCEAFLTLAADTPATPESASAVASVRNRLPELVDSYARARRHASAEELEQLNARLLESVEQLGVYAEEHRQALLQPLVQSFEEQKSFLDNKTAQPALGPV